MKITAIHATPVNIPYRNPARMAAGTMEHSTRTIIEVQTDAGCPSLYATDDRRLHSQEQLDQSVRFRGEATLNAADPRTPITCVAIHDVKAGAEMIAGSPEHDRADRFIRTGG